jgi:hypothetical protein
VVEKEPRMSLEAWRRGGERAEEDERWGRAIGRPYSKSLVAEKRKHIHGIYHIDHGISPWWLPRENDFLAT